MKTSIKIYILIDVFRSAPLIIHLINNNFCQKMSNDF